MNANIAFAPAQVLCQHELPLRIEWEVVRDTVVIPRCNKIRNVVVLVDRRFAS